MKTKEERNANSRKWNKEHPERVKANSEKYIAAHPEEVKARTKKWGAEHRDQRNAAARINRRLRRKEIKEARLAIRRMALEHYGGKCECCGETRYEFLAFDHINGGGYKHRKEIKNRSMAAWLKMNNYPEGYQILCHNCNQSKGLYGYCPHQKEIVNA